MCSGLRWRIDTDFDSEKVNAFVAQYPLFYPILLDAGSKVNEQFGVGGIPRSFFHNREGKLTAEAINMRTRDHFIEMWHKLDRGSSPGDSSSDISSHAADIDMVRTDCQAKAAK